MTAKRHSLDDKRSPLWVISGKARVEHFNVRSHFESRFHGANGDQLRTQHWRPNLTTGTGGKMNRSLNIRPAFAAEYERLSVLWKDDDYLHYQALPQIFREPDEVWPSRSAVETLILGPDSTILVAEMYSEIVGLVTLKVHQVKHLPIHRERRFVMIDNMAVDPIHRRLGIGRALLRASDDWAHQRGIAALQLFVWEFNGAAVRFYESEGFETVVRGMARGIAEVDAPRRGSIAD
jgi:diamine N-acetyltransferase